MPQRQEPVQAHTPVAKPDGQQLSEQERQDLDAAARGIDTAVSALPDDGPPPAPPRAKPSTPDPQTCSENPLAAAQSKGLLPKPEDSGMPLDGQLHGDK